MTMIDLYTAATPNGYKVSCTLEELELPYETHAINMTERQQKEEWFLAMNPNGRIPVIKDRGADDLVVFESGAIMIYLAEKVGSPLLPTTGPARYEVLQWLMFQMGGIGPMMGQANVFYRYFPEKIPAAIERYQNESRRLCEVLDRRLAESEWLAKDYSLADIANWAWVRIHVWPGVSLDGLDHLTRWLDALEGREALQRGLGVPERRELPKDGAEAEKFAGRVSSIVQR